LAALLERGRAGRWRVRLLLAALGARRRLTPAGDIRRLTADVSTYVRRKRERAHPVDFRGFRDGWRWYRSCL
jgi:hypothetical protein